MGSIEVIAVAFGDANGYITHDEDDATTATLFTPDSNIAATLQRPQASTRWGYDYSDYLNPGDGLRELTWLRAADAFADLAADCGVTFTIVEP